MAKQKPEDASPAVRAFDPVGFFIGLAVTIIGCLTSLLVAGLANAFTPGAWLGYFMSLMLGFASHVITILIKLCAKIPHEIQASVQDCLISMPEAFHDNFHKTTRDLLGEYEVAPEVRATAADFVRESFDSTFRSGFVLARADFSAYSQKTLNLVAQLYTSADANRIWTVCLYSPLDYLILRLRAPDPGKQERKTDHLLIFDGFRRLEGGAVEPFAHVETTSMLRVSYLDQARLGWILGHDSPLAGLELVSERDRKELLNATAFAYIWFLFYNRNIRLRWGWLDQLAVDIGSGDMDEDFMILDQSCMWLYDTTKRMLQVCWYRPDQTGPAETHPFEGNRMRFDKASKMFLALEKAGKKNAKKNAKKDLHAPIVSSHPTSLYSKVETAFSEEVRTRLMDAVLQGIDVWLAWSTDGLKNSDKAGLATIKASVLNPLKARILVDQPPDWSKVEDTLRELLVSLGKDDLLRIYQFLESQSFVDRVCTSFPIFGNKGMLGRMKLAGVIRE